jgi:hypothetical protein
MLAGGLTMRKLAFFVIGLLVAMPALATTYSGTGAWSLFTPDSPWSPSDPIIWSFTTGAQTAPDQFEVTDFSMQVGNEAWTLADFEGLNSSAPYAIILPTGLEILFTGVNSSNTALYTGLLIVQGPSSPWLSTTFGVFNPGLGFSGGISALGRLATVPEPASWAMLIAGFGLIGTAARRQRLAAA